MKNKLDVKEITQYFKQCNHEEKLIFFWGVVGPMPLLEIAGLSFFSVFIVLVMFYGIIKSKKVFIGKERNVLIYALLTLLAPISALRCLISDMPAVWKNEQIKNIIWYIIYFVVFAMYANRRNFHKLKAYFYGVFLSGLIQLVWGYFQLFIYNITGKSLNDIIFIDLLNVSRGFATQYKGNTIALSGMCWNAANMAPLMVFLYCFTSSPFIKIAIILLSLLSGSRTVLVGIVICVVVEGIQWFKKKRISSKKLIGLFVTTPILVMGIVFFLIFKQGLMSNMLEKMSTLLDSFSTQHMSQEGSAFVHIRYITSIGDIVQRSGIINSLFGYGLGCSGYPFALYYHQWGGISGGAWSTECDYTYYIWGTGLIAFVIRYVWYMKNCIKSKNVNPGYFLFFISYFIQALTYNVSFNWNLLLILFLIVYITYHEDFTAIESRKGNTKYSTIQ